MKLYEVHFDSTETAKVIVIICLAESEKNAIKIGKDYTAKGEPSRVIEIPLTEEKFLSFDVR